MRHISFALALWVSTCFADGGVFYAHNNGVAQQIPAAQYVVVTLSTTKFDDGSHFHNSRWYPPAGPVSLAGQLFILDSGGIPVNPSYVAKVIKNGNADVCTGIGAAGSLWWTVVMQFACNDKAEPGDYYELWVLASSNTYCLLDGNPSHTFLSGRF